MKIINLINKNPFYLNVNLKDIKGEEWIDVIGFDGSYEVSNFGRVKSVGRFVAANGGSERWVKERILKQAVMTSALIATLCINGICKRFLVSRLMFFSFNYNIKGLPEYYVMHINNNPFDNRTENLRIDTLKEIANNTYNHGKWEHLKNGNPVLSKHNRESAEIKVNKIISKICVKCGKRKDSKYFRNEHNKCKTCVWEEYRIKLGTKKRRSKGLKATCQITGKIIFYKNYNDKNLLKLVSITSAMKYVKNNTICKPYLRKQNFNPFKLEEINQTK